MTASQRKGIIGAVVCESDAETDAARWAMTRSSAPRKKAQNASQRAYGGRRTAQGGEVDGQAILARSMSEKALSQHVVNLARMLGWRVARWPTWRATGTDPGVPDLVMAKGDRVYFVELKAESGVLSDDQRAWYDLITAAAHMAAPHVVMWVWRPSSWLDGTIERILRGEA